MPLVKYQLEDNRGEICTVTQDAVPRIGDTVDVYKNGSGMQGKVTHVWWRVDEDVPQLTDVVVVLDC